MQERSVHSTAELRKVNRNRVYRYLYSAAEPTTKQDLAVALSMSLPTLTQNLNELLAAGLLDNSEIAGSTGGRKPRILSVVPDARYAVGAELSPHHIRMVAVDLKGQELGFRVTDRPFRVDHDYAQGLRQDLEAFFDENGLARDRVLGVGLTLPGILDAHRAVLLSAPTMGAGEIDLAPLTGAIPYPLFLDNDASSGGFAESWSRTGPDSMVYLSVSRGVGGAILIRGVPYDGRSRRAAEFGHMCIHPGGRACGCGRRGCLEAYCSTARLSEDLGMELEGFFARLASGGGEKAGLWAEYLENLALGICNIYTALDCDLVLGGTLSQFLGGRIEELKARIRALDANWPEDSLHLCHYHGRSNSIGAALHFIDGFLGTV